MSYDLRISVRVHGTDLHAVIATPEYDNPTYNLGVMFRMAMDWDFKQGDWYPCAEVFDNITRGIQELTDQPDKYRQYEPDNGWGTIEQAIRGLKSLKNCICEQMEEIPLEHLYVAW